MPADFKRLLVSRFLFYFGAQMQAVLVGWRMYELTHDPLHLGFIGLAEALPAIGIALYAGYVVDRSRPVFVYGNVVFGSLVSVVILILSQSGLLSFSVANQVMCLYVASFITGAVRGFAQPSMFAIVPKLVPRSELARSSAWTTSAMQMSRILGPAVGGLLFGWLGFTVSVNAVGLAMFIALLFVFLIRSSIPPHSIRGGGEKLRDEILMGAKYVFRHPILLPAMSLDMVSVLFGGVTAMLPIYASEILHVGPQGLGFLRAFPAVGAIVISLLLTRLDIRENAGRWFLASVAGFGVSILIFGISHDFWLSALALALSGAFDSVSMVVRTSAVQLASPDHMRGRISAVNSVFIGSSNEIGEFESGVAAHFMGTVPSVLFGGVMCLLTVFATLFISRPLRTLNLHRVEQMAQDL